MRLQKCFRNGINFSRNKILSGKIASQIVSVSGTHNITADAVTSSHKAPRLSNGTVIPTERQGNQGTRVCCSFSHQAGSRRELPLDASLAPHPALSYPIPTHSIPSQSIPSHSIPSHVISSHPTPSQLILWLSISWPHWTTTHRAGDPQGCPAPTPDAVPVPREGPTAAFVCWGALQRKSGLDPMQHKLLLSVHRKLLFSNAKKSFLVVFFCAGHEWEYGGTGKDSCSQ